MEAGRPWRNEDAKRYHAPRPSIGIIAHGPRAEVDTAYNKSELNGNNRYNNQAILNMLAGKSYTATELQAEVKALTGMSRATFYDSYWPEVQQVKGVVCAVGRYTYTKPATAETSTATS